jgi:hypothetical protein
MTRVLLAALAFALAAPALAGSTSSYMGTKSPLRFHVLQGSFSGTSDTTGLVVGECPPGGATLRDIILVQTGAGVAGHHWQAIPKKNGTASLDAALGAPGFTVAAGASKVTNVGSRPVAFTLPTGGTRPVIDVSTATCSGGELYTLDIDIVGTYASGTATLATDLAVTEKVTIQSVDFVARNRYASNVVTCSGVLAADTVTIAGVVFTAVNGGTPTAVQFDMSGTDAADCAALAAAVTASTNEALVGVVTAVNVPTETTVTFTSVAEGAPGNDITLATSTGVRLAITTAGGKLAGAYVAASDEWWLGSTLAISATNLANAIRNSANAAIAGVVDATAAEAVVTVTADAGGTGGNAITFTKTGTHITVTGSGTLTGATNYSTGPSGLVQLYLEPRW